MCNNLGLSHRETEMILTVGDDWDGNWYMVEKGFSLLWYLQELLGVLPFENFLKGLV